MRLWFLFFQVTLILQTEQQGVLTYVTNTMKCHHVIMNDVFIRVFLFPVCLMIIQLIHPLCITGD